MAFMEPTSIDRRHRNIVEALRRTRPHVEDARFPRMVQEVKIDLYSVFDGDKVAYLLTIAIAAGSHEQLNFALRLILVEEMKTNCLCMT